MAYRIENFAATTLAQAVGAADVQILLAPPTLPMRLPAALGGGETGVLVLADDLANPTRAEIVTYTGRLVNGDGTCLLTGVVRAREGTTALSWTPGAWAYQTVTQAMVADWAVGVDPELSALAALTSAANKLPYYTGLGTAALADLTAFARTLIDDADAAAARTTLGLGTLATQASNGVAITGGSISGASFSGTFADGEIAALAGLASAANKLPYFTGSGTAALADLSAAGRALLDDADAAAQRTTLSVREQLTANRTYYVATTGSDSNNGLSAGAPFLTIQKAVDVAATLDASIYTVTIQLAAGTYTTGVTLKPVLGAAAPVLQGNTADPAAQLISLAGGTCINGANCGTWTVRGIKVQNTAGTGIAVSGAGANLNISYLHFGACSVDQIQATGLGRVGINGPWTIAGGAVNHISSYQQGQVIVGSYTCTLTGTPAFSNAFVQSTILSMVNFGSPTWSGSATGPRYAAHANATIVTNGAGATWLPGSSAGVTGTGGVYI